MGNVPVQFRKRKQRQPLKHARREDILADRFEGLDQKPIDTQHLLISALLPPAVKAFMKECEREVDELCGNRYSCYRNDDSTDGEHFGPNPQNPDELCKRD